MITCSVCGAENDSLAVTCTSCKSFLQAKVDNLDLFATLWGLCESPGATFRRIVLARHKNYVVLLSSLLGISVAYAAFWYRNAGVFFTNLFTILGAGLMIGPPLGLLLVAAFGAIVAGAGRMLGGKGSVRNCIAVVAYSCMPIVFSLVLVFPVEVAVFGLYFFDHNPPPLVLNPVVYIALLGFDTVAVIWSWVLLIEGSIIVHGFTRRRAFFIAVGVAVIVAGAAYAGRWI